MSPARRWAIVVGLVTCGVVLAGDRRNMFPAGSGAAESPALRVCADPNSLPFSNQQREGFENKLAEMIARQWRLPAVYTWRPQRRGFIRELLHTGTCDLVMGLPAGIDITATTRPYYRSSYVFVARADRNLQLSSLDDPRLRRLRIGVQMIGDDFANSPPAHALSARGIIGNVVGYSVLGNYAEPNPPARIVDAVAGGAVDAAVVWGPLAGYFAARQPVAMELTQVQPEIDLPFLPFVFDIAIGVRRGDDDLRARLDAFIEAHAADIRRLLDHYDVPQFRPTRGRP